MSLHDHAWYPRPNTARPVIYRTHTPLWQRAWSAARPWLVVAGLLLAIVVGTALVITRLQVTEAQLERVHAQGMAVGMTMCGGR